MTTHSQAGTDGGVAGYAASAIRVVDNGRTVIDDFNLTLQPGTWINFPGGAKADTSRLLGALSGRQPRNSGTIILDGEPLTARSSPAEVSYVRQRHPLIQTLTAAESVICTLMIAGHHDTAELRRRAEKQLDALDLPAGTWHNLVEQLSGGQQQRVALAQALVARPRLLVLDDPTSELDPDTTQLVVTLIDRATRRGACCLTSSNEAAIRKLSHHEINQF